MSRAAVGRPAFIATGDATRSLYAFHALCDLLLIADAGWLVETVAGKVRARAEVRVLAAP